MLCAPHFMDALCPSFHGCSVPLISWMLCAPHFMDALCPSFHGCSVPLISWIHSAYILVSVFNLLHIQSNSLLVALFSKCVLAVSKNITVGMGGVRGFFFLSGSGDDPVVRFFYRPKFSTFLEVCIPKIYNAYVWL